MFKEDILIFSKMASIFESGWHCRDTISEGEQPNNISSQLRLKMVKDVKSMNVYGWTESRQQVMTIAHMIFGSSKLIINLGPPSPLLKKKTHLQNTTNYWTENNYCLANLNKFCKSICCLSSYKIK